MGSSFTCIICRTPNAVGLPEDDGPLVTCSACKRPHPRHYYEKESRSAAAPAAQTLLLLSIGAACAVGVIGLAGVLTVGSVLKKSPGPWMNAFAVLMSMTFAGFGMRAILSPDTLRIAPNEGTDAWGKNKYGATRTSTAKEGTRMGIIFLAVSVVLLLLGIFFGRLAR